MIDVNLFVRDVNLFVRVLGTMTHSLCSNLFCPFARVRTIYNNSSLCGVARSSPKVTMQLAAWMAWNAVLLRACVHVSCICKVLTQLLSGPSRSDRGTRAINHGSNQPVSQASCMSQYASIDMQRSKQTRQMDKGSNSATVVQVLFYPLYIMNDSVLHRTFCQYF